MTAGSILVPQVIPLRISTPGKAKHEIDTNTLVEIKSDTPNVAIYYTTDGSKPELFRRVGFGDHTTFKYSGPITLPEGKITVKALAVTKDCRESAIVTKVFVVDYATPNTHVPVENNDENFHKDLSRQEMESRLSDFTGRKKEVNEESKAQQFQGVSKEKRATPSPFPRPRLLNNYLNTFSDRKESPAAILTPQSQITSSAVNNRKTVTSTQALRIQRETDFLKCMQCLAPRAADPFAHYCQECGSLVPPVPGRNLPSPGAAQMGLCIECQNVVPMNTPKCIVCEAPIAPQLQPRASFCVKGKVLCLACGAGNPIHIKRCVICESQLPEAQMAALNGEVPPPGLGQLGKTISCSKCGRVNDQAARFCDWCGAKPGPPPCTFTCFKCSAHNHPYARFCSVCGVYIEPLSRSGSQNSILLNAGDGFIVSESNNLHQSSISFQTSRPDLLGRKEQGTQTIGLFYPSSKLMEKKECELVSQIEKQNKKNDRRPLLTAISPGRGYWRKQLDHICAYLRNYAQNNLEFRTLIGEPRMGKIISAAVHEDDYQVSLRLNYALAINKESLTNKPVKFDDWSRSSSKAGRDGLYGSQASLANEESTRVSSPREKAKRTMKTIKGVRKEDKLSPESRQLLKEVGPEAEGQSFLIEQLIDEGADPNCTNDDDQPALTLAVLNKHHEVIPVLVQKGANIDHQSGPRFDNTALHEAVLLGLDGRECIQALLGCNANIKKKNSRGFSAYDLALKNGSDETVSLFACKLGQGMLDKLTACKLSPANY